MKQRVKSLFSDESARLERAAEVPRIAPSHLHAIGDALQEMIVFVGREERCHYYSHGASYAQEFGIGGPGPIEEIS